MSKKKGQTKLVRIPAEAASSLEEIAKNHPLRPKIGQLIGQLVREQKHTLTQDNRPG